MLARIWRGATRADDHSAYLDYLRHTGFKEYRETPGNRGVLALSRRRGDRAEFLLLTLWDSVEAIRRFAGDDIDGPCSIPRTTAFSWSAI
jgi:heme-degrading monooxygenase HmoA